jgi:DNA replication protein DnaC
MPELAPMLKQLRLSGILDSLESRNKQAIDKKMAYPEFLALLIADEVARRDQKRFTTRLRRASFRSHKTLDQFNFDFNPNINAALIHELITGRFIEEKVAVLIAGPCGTGKSHIAQAIGHAAVRQGHDVLFTSQSQLLGQLHAARATDSYERKFTNLARVPLLIIDDFGLKPLRPPHDEDFHDLVAERYERTATVITSNLDFGEWGDAFPNQLLGAATLDRLRHGAYRVVLDGKSYRSPRPMENQLENKPIVRK